jgi:hypothetical protein
MTVTPDRLFAVSGLTTGTNTANAIAASMSINELMAVRDWLVEQQDATASALQRIDNHMDRLGQSVRAAEAAGVATAAPIGTQAA